MLIPDQTTTATMADAAVARSILWCCSAEIAHAPTPEFVAKLRDGRFAETIGRNSTWVGEDSPFEDLLKTMGAFQNRSARFSAEDDFASLVAEYERLAVETEVAEQAEAFAELALRESEAWRAGHHEQAKEQRLAQFQAMEQHLEWLATWCQRIDDDTEVLIVQVLARIFAAQVTLESGRNLLGSLERSGGRTATFQFA